MSMKTSANFARKILSSVASIILMAGFSTAADAQAFLQYDVPTANAQPLQIISGPKGYLYFTERGGNKIGRIKASSGNFSELILPAGSSPYGIAVGSDGAVWYTDQGANKIGRIDPENFSFGGVRQYSVPTSPSNISDIVSGYDGALYFAENFSNKIGRITTQGVVTEIPIGHANASATFLVAGNDGKIYFNQRNTNQIGSLDLKTSPPTYAETAPMPGSSPLALGLGPDGSILFTETGTNSIGRYLDGVVTHIPIPKAASFPRGITTGIDGSIWFTEQDGNKIGRIEFKPGFPVTEYDVPVPSFVAAPAPSREPTGIALGPDGAIWFTERVGNRVSRITSPVASNDLLAATLPYARSVRAGTVATAFATIINNTALPMTQCGIAPSTSVPAIFTFQTTNPQTNALMGQPNARVNIAPNSSQSFVMSFNARAPRAGSDIGQGGDVKLGYTCLGAEPRSAGSAFFLNSFALAIAQNPVPDIIAVGLSPSNDGYVHSNGIGGSGGVFAVATSNIGAPGGITIAAGVVPLGPSGFVAAELNTQTAICETEPATGVCKAPPTNVLTRIFAQNETPTFGIFVVAGQDVPPDPVHTRLLVLFSDVDGDNTVRGATSIAFTTQ